MVAMSDLQAFKRWRVAALLALISVSLTGCFDLAQKVTINRHGAGQYQVAVTAGGLVGEGLEKHPAHIDDHGRAKVVTTVTHENGHVTQTSTIAFHQLSDLDLSDETISLHVLGKSFFGLGPTHVRFRRTFLVGNAKHAHGRRLAHGEEVGKQIMLSVFGDHTYSFSVTLPGSILSAAPIKCGKRVIQPVVTGSVFGGHTVTWTMPLYIVLSQPRLTFTVVFSAYGDFKDAHSIAEDTTSL
jgi:hypothetical protein